MSVLTAIEELAAQTKIDDLFVRLSPKRTARGAPRRTSAPLVSSTRSEVPALQRPIEVFVLTGQDEVVTQQGSTESVAVQQTEQTSFVLRNRAVVEVRN